MEGKLKASLARRFPAKQHDAILKLYRDPQRLAATAVDEFAGMFVI
jgi:hypothetical protein